MSSASGRTTGFLLAGLAVALVLAFGVSRWASSEPDGLERVAADRGIDRGEQPHALGEGPLADYGTAGIDDPGLSTGVAGVIGVAVTFAVAAGAVLMSRRVRRRPGSGPGGDLPEAAASP